jgi:hypothetical protein
MNTRTLVTVGLLLFVAATIVAVIIRDRGGSASAEAGTREPSLDGPRLVAWYLHGEKRCMTCRKIESTTQEAISKNFAEDMASGRLVWRVMNYDDPGNEHLMDDYDIASPSVILAWEDKGEVQRWANLDRVWELIGDTPAYEAYVASEVTAYLEVGK